MKKIESAWEYFFVFAQPTIMMFPFILVVGYMASRAFAGADGKLNESREGWDLIGGFMAMMGLCLFFGHNNVRNFYGIEGSDSMVFIISLLTTLGGVGKLTSKILESAFHWIQNSTKK